MIRGTSRLVYSIRRDGYVRVIAVVVAPALPVYGGCQELQQVREFKPELEGEVLVYDERVSVATHFE